MTRDRAIRLLVSVRDADEARAAMEGGADTIDIKEPSRGSLGRADDHVIQAVIGAVAARRLVSAALGELRDAVRPPRADGLTYVKVGLAGAGADWWRRLDDVAQAAAPARLVAVAYADHARAAAPRVEDVLHFACVHGAAAMLIDTAIKDGSTLLDWLGPSALIEFVRAARAAGMLCALAGALGGDALGRVIDLAPDVIAVRGAACAANDRRSPVDASRVRALVRAIEGRTAPAGLAAG